jgi:GntR family transcriptional regulator, vanillate catabolism transcriptional regulator
VSDSQNDSLPPTLLARPQMRLADQVAQVLRDLVLRGELAPGTPLLQIQLAERLGVSRTPLREAFRILERDGLLRISNGNKTVEVIELDRQHLIDTYQVRDVIDGLAARLAAARGLSAQSSEQMQRAIDRMEVASRTGLDIGEYGEGHIDFHLAVLDASGNSRLDDFAPLVRLSAHMLLTRYLRQTYGQDVDETIQQAVCIGNEDHRKIFDAIRDGDVKGSERAASQHIRRTIKYLETLPEARQAQSLQKHTA